MYQVNEYSSVRRIFGAEQALVSTPKTFGVVGRIRVGTSICSVLLYGENGDPGSEIRINIEYLKDKLATAGVSARYGGEFIYDEHIVAIVSCVSGCITELLCGCVYGKLSVTAIGGIK